MNATPLLSKLLAALGKEDLEAVLIGNAAAAIHGAPVTTLDFDFMFRETTANMRKLKRVAAALDATILRPYYPVSRLVTVHTLIHNLPRISGVQVHVFGGRVSAWRGFSAEKWTSPRPVNGYCPDGR